MNKNLVLIVAGGAVAFIAFKMMNKKTGAAVVPNSGAYAKNAAPAAPNGTYPSQPAQSPRVDNQSQPWYNNSKIPLNYAQPQASGLVGLAQQVSAGASIVNSLSDVWGNISDLFPAGSNDVGSADEWGYEDDYFDESDDWGDVA